MHVDQIARALAAGVFGVVLVTAAGCPSSGDKGGEKPKSTESKQSPADKSPAAAKSSDESATPRSAAGEFQQPPALPLDEPPPKLAQEPVDVPAPPDAPTTKKPAEDKPVPAKPTKEAEKARPDKPATDNPKPDKPAPDKSVWAASATDTTIDKPSPARQTEDDLASDKPAADVDKTAAEKRVADEHAAGELTRVSKKLPLRPQTAKNSGVKFDPVKENGPIFVGWKKPKVALVITGMEQGYIEPCGCAGLDRMKGGMSRRYSLLKQLRKDGWPVVALDVGGLANGRNREAEMKFYTLAKSKKEMHYDAVGFGVDDLRLPAGELVRVAAEVNGKPSPFVSANVALFGFDAKVTETSRIVEAGGVKIGVTSILGKKYREEINTPEPVRDIEMSDAETALGKVVPELKRQSDYMVLLSHATRQESIELAKKFPEFNAVVCSDGHDLPPNEPEVIAGTKTLLITVGHKGMHAVVLGLFDDAKKTLLYQSVPLDSRFPLSPEMKRLMAEFQEELKLVGFAELGLRPAPHPLAETNGQFVGSAKCESCHEKSYYIWKRSGHAKGYKTLAELDPPRDFDPECISCHVVGWHPTKYFPYKGGFESAKTTPWLKDVGCEDCHGPGEKHVEAELGNNEQLQAKYRKAVVITKEQSKKEQCSTCHDLENSPDFDFDKYWPLVEHYEKEEE